MAVASQLTLASVVVYRRVFVNECVHSQLTSGGKDSNLQKLPSGRLTEVV